MATGGIDDTGNLLMDSIKSEAKRRKQNREGGAPNSFERTDDWSGILIVQPLHEQSI